MPLRCLRKISGVDHIEDPLCIINCFTLAAFNILSLVFDNLIKMCLNAGLSVIYPNFIEVFKFIDMCVL